MSKFDYGIFSGGYDDFAVNAEKYTIDEAIKLYAEELCGVSFIMRDTIKNGDPILIAVEKAFVRHRAGVNEDNEPCVGWWIEYNQQKRSCPAWVFHLHHERYAPGQCLFDFDKSRGYEIINLQEWIDEHDG